MFREYFCLHRKFLLYNLVSRNLKLKYRKSYLGIFWTVLGPAASAIIYFSVFKFVMKVQIPNYLVFILSGTVAWNFFATAVLQGQESIVGNHSLITKVPIPLNVFPLTECISLFINFLFSIPVLFVVSVITGAPITAYWLLLPFFFFLLFLQTYALSLTLAICFVFLRDLRHLFNIVIQIWFYLNPIIYASEMIPEKYRWALYVLPTSFIFEFIHKIVAYGELADLNKAAATVIWTLVLVLFSLFILKKYKDVLAEKI